ncbi:MAG: DNA-3-methyladenine glycosylase I [Methylacidiphilales bacterium]|nr:DNA-3-methyladenine glycosylase I [Candidatus Methylacidiphilales bacterium]
MKKRCPWCLSDPIYVAYHDEEWGRPEHDDRRLFEKLILDGAQAGLSWITILKRREGYRRAFDHFDPEKIVRYDKKKITALMKDPGIIRNRLKIEAAIGNAKAYLALKKELGSFDRYLWSFTGGKTLRQPRGTMGDLPTTSPEAEAMSRDLKKRGFRFVGPTICYAFMQAIGMVDDHIDDCFRSKKRKRN